MTSQSLIFDRAVDFYDSTRAIPAQVSEQVTESILRVGRRSAGPDHEPRFLEVGVGTGRIAAPVILRDARLVGVDLSFKMMRLIPAKLPAGVQPPLAQADISRLPFVDAGFDTVIAVHVFHLVGPWQAALDEVRRVLQPGGVLLLSWDRREPHSPTRTLRQKWRRLVETHGESTRRPGAEPDEVLTYLVKHGARARTLEVARWTELETPNDVLRSIAARENSTTWQVSDAVLAATLDELRAWALREYGDLDRPDIRERRFVFKEVRFPATSAS